MPSPKWVRVRDTKTGHEYDVAERSAANLPEGVELLQGVEPHTGAARPPKYADKAAAGPPAKSAPRGDWEAFAVDHAGMTAEDAAAFANKDELIAAVTKEA